MDNNGTDSPLVGSAIFEYGHREEGSLARFGFTMRVGDNPDFWKARLLMPGAEFQGICYAAFEDTGTVEPEEDWRVFTCVLAAGRSMFLVDIPSRSLEEARARCSEIGGLRPQCDLWNGQARPAGMLERASLVLRWFWERRPVVRFRSPLSIFD